MNFFLICPVGVIGGKSDLLTYSATSNLSPGMVVHIPFGNRTVLGVVIKKTSKPAFSTKQISSTLGEYLPIKLLGLAEWMSDYYAVRLPLVLQTMLPSGLGKKRRQKELATNNIRRTPLNDPLSEPQINAVESIIKSTQITQVLHGVTGSGKTRVYLEVAKRVLAMEKSVLVLVPEIALTPQLAAEFEQLNDRVMVLHSGLTEAERHLNFQNIQAADHPWVIVGPRSSLFSPLDNLGLIVVDECHEPSYQQDSQPKYSALRVARKLAELHNDTKLILGSATPLVTDYFVAQKTKANIITLPLPVRKSQTTVEIIDIADKDTFGRHPLFSRALLSAIDHSMQSNRQIMLFHNRRGTARLGLCSNCGWAAECSNCHVPLRLHHDIAELRCHICGRSEHLPVARPVCDHPNIDFKGFGSKRIEIEIKKLYPRAVIARFDSDTPMSEQLHHRYQDLFDGRIQIVIGTQGIAKGLDLPLLDTVGIIQADSELFIPDFSSNERSFQLTTQVIGRAGRAGQPAKVFIQTLNPGHPVTRLAAHQDYQGFYKYEIKERRAEHMPPLTFLLQLKIGYASSAKAEQAASTLKQQLVHSHPEVYIRGPAPAFHEHQGSKYYQQLILSCHNRKALVEIATTLPSKWQYSLDPLNLL